MWREGSTEGRLADPQPWRDVLPPDLFQSLQRWIAGQTFVLRFRRWRTEGRSGSYVASVVVEPFRGMLTGAILKLLPAKLAEAEARGTTLAAEDSPPDFADRHLTRTRWIGPLPGNTGVWLHLQEVAGSGTATMLSLRDLIGDECFADHCRTVVTALMDSWNDGRDDPSPRTLTPQDFLAEDLADKVDGIQKFVANATVDRGAVALPGRPDLLPDPLGVLNGIGRREPFMVFRGRGHGDLNLDNVLLPVVGGEVTAAEFRLIDFGRYSPVTPVSRDPAKLLLSAAAAWLPGLLPGAAIRSSLAELVVSPADYPSSPSISGYLSVARAIMQGAASWATRRGLAQEWAEQHRLTLAAAALRTVGRADLSDADRWWHVEVAAIALQPLLPQSPGGPADLSMSPATPPTIVRPAASPPKGSMGATKYEFVKRLGPGWIDLADILEIPPHERGRFPLGNEARYIWEWLEQRGRLNMLASALRDLGRAELADRVGGVT